ncbi:MAG: S8/S53 family peptidase, partial [Halobacteriales archaeon]|nr:S8/S53 family peptidase [Halobacteriales archaeon]
LYYVPGTRIVGAISFGNSTFGNAQPNTHPILDDDGHGTGTSSTAARNAPDASIVMVESGADELEEAITWASSQPWIDVVSISIGPLLNSPVPQELDAQTAGYVPPTRLAWERGAMVFAAAGNDPSLSATGPIAGPPWVVSVGGAYPGSSSDPGTSSKAMDVVSDYGPVVATRDSVDATQVEHGTSFSCPAVAGAAAQALYWLRARAGDDHGIAQGRLLAVNGPGLAADGLTNAELRRAMNGVAQYWDATSWSLADGAPELAPWAQMGWGYLDGKDAQRIADAAWSGEVPEKPAEAQAYMGAMQQSRAMLWP